MGHLATKDLFGVDLEIDGWVQKNSSMLKECARNEVMENMFQDWYEFTQVIDMLSIQQ
jgi:hypothetical protein